MGTNHVESSLKRFLKRKIKVTLGLVVTFMITGTVGFAAEYSGEHKEISNDQNAILTGETKVTNSINNSIVKGENQKLTTSSITGSSINAKELYVENSNENSNGIIANKDNTITGNKIIINTKHSGIVSDHIENGNLKISANYLESTASTGLRLDGSGKIDIDGMGENSTLILKGNSGGGITLRKSGEANNGELKIKNFKTVNISGYNGILVGERGNNTGLIDINAENVIISSNSAGNAINVTGTGKDEKQATIKINGSNEVLIQSSNSSGKAIDMTQGGNLYLNNESKGDLKINGFVYVGAGNSKSDVIMNFNNNNSFMNGYIKLGSNTTSNLKFSDGAIMTGGIFSTEDTTITNVEISNNAIWNNKGEKIKWNENYNTSKINNLIFNNGIINNDKYTNGDEESFSNIEIKTITGTGGTINTIAEIDENNKAVSGKLKFGEIKDSNTKFEINYKGSGKAEVNKNQAENYFKNLTENITVEKGQFNADAKLEEGFVSREYTSEFVRSETGDIIVKEDSVKIGNLNSMIIGMRDLATINLLTWRQEMSSLNQRMGELRNSTGEHGVWSRVYTGKIENNSAYDNEYQTYQVGYDKKYTVNNGVVFVGGLVSYSKGETNYALGDGENYSVGAGIYATWLNNDGQFADVILKQSRLHNKFDVNGKDNGLSQHGEYNNWGTSLSGQYGKRFDLNDKFFVEPSAQLTLGRVDSVSYSTNAGVDVEQDSMYSLIGDLGTSIGYKFSDKGNVYARAAFVKEFQGDIDTTYSKDNAVEKTTEDLSDSWAEFGIGVNYRFAENVNVYLDLEKSGDAAIDTEWQANLGFRWEF